jgi:NADH:ubiquinone oxidoreductase subunit 5 (subunit L)/multisubunit Na+/H+ antiporter MnhA subunit
LPLYLSFLGAFFVYYYNYLFIKFSYYKVIFNLKFLYYFLIKKWYFDTLYNFYFIYSFIFPISFFTFKDIDRGLVEVFGPLGLVRLFSYLIKRINIFQTGFLFNYIFIIILGILFYLFAAWFIIYKANYFIYIDSRFYFICILVLLFYDNSSSINNKKIMLVS